MSSPNFIPVDKSPATDLMLRHVYSWHTTLEKQSEALDKSSIELTKFLSKEWTAEEIKQNGGPYNILYQYHMINQETFEKEIKTFEKATSSIFPIVESLQKEIYSALKPQQQMPQQGGTNVSVQIPQPEKTSFWSNPFRRKDTRYENVTDLNQYTRSTSLIDEVMQVPVFLSKFKDYHWHGVTRSRHLYFGDLMTQGYYLSNEIRYFHTMVVPKIQQVVDEGRRLKFVLEKEIMAPILGEARAQADRRDMQPKMGPQ